MIVLEYSLSEEDFLTFQLYVASTSPNIIKKRTKVRYRVPVMYGILALLIFWIGETEMAVAFIIIGLLWLVFYPKWEKHRYCNHYRDHIKENYTGRINISSELHLKGNEIYSKDNFGEATFKTEGIKAVNEIANYYFLQIDRGVGLIFPKNKIGDVPAIDKWLKEVERQNGITRTVNLDWAWK